MSTKQAMNTEQLITENIDLWTSAIKAKKTQGRGSSKKRELYGIKKLRELILELAVRGKLVPQDPSDEPASILLERIATEKAQLVKDKKIKKPKPLQEIDDKEKTYELPLGWQWARFIDVLDFTGGGQPPKSVFSEVCSEGYVQLIQIRDLGPNPQPVFVPLEKVSKFCTEQDIMIGRYGASVGKVFWGKNGAYNVALIKVDNQLGAYNSNFLFNLLISPLGQSFFGGISRSAQDGFSKDDIAPRLVPIPPVNEQLLITRKVDELMALCDQLEQQTEASLDAHQLLVDTLLGSLLTPCSPKNAEDSQSKPAEGSVTNAKGHDEFSENWARLSEHFDTLITTDYAVEQLKQTILQLAVMGKLVPQDPSDEPASELLKRIAAEKEQLIKDKKIKKQKTLPEITDEEKPFELPEGWEWCRFDDIVEIGSGVTKGRKLAGRETVFVPYLRVANVQRNELVLDVIKDIEIGADEVEKYQVQYGDLLITEGGDWDKVGRTAIWRDETEYMAHQNHVFKARQIGDEHNEVWLEKFLNSKSSRDYFAGSSKQTTNLASINKTQLRGTVVAIPPSEEQDRIVDMMNPLLALCDQLKARLSEAQTTQLQLADTVVDEALI